MIRLMIAGMLLLSCAGEALACKCLPPPPPQAAMNEVDAVFMGKVKSVAAGQEGNQTITTFTISKSWKGLKGEETVRLIGHGTSCDIRFEPGKEYIVYCHLREGKYSTHACTRTRSAEKAEEEIKDLDAAVVEE